MKQVFEKRCLVGVRYGIAHRIKRTTEGSHQLGFVATTHLSTRKQFEGTYHRIVAHSATLYDNMTAQLLGVLQLQHLVEAVAHHRISQSGRKVGHRSTFAKHLLHLRVHEHSATCTEVAGSQTQTGLVGKIGNVVAQTGGKGREERAATRRTSLVDLHAVDDTILHEDSLHVLTTNVEDEAYILVDMMSRQEVRDGLDDAMVELEGSLDEILAVASAARTEDAKTRIGRRQTGIETLQPLLHRMNRIAAIGDIVIVDDAALGVEHYNLGGRGTRVDT